MKYILLADDQSIPRHMIRSVIAQRSDWEVMGEACDGIEAVEKAREACPDLAILDIQMPRMNGIEAAKKILECCPAAIVLTDSSHAVEPLLNELRKAGIRGFVPKMEIGTSLIPAIETVLGGGEWFKVTLAANDDELLAPLPLTLSSSP